MGEAQGGSGGRAPHPPPSRRWGALSWIQGTRGHKRTSMQGRGRNLRQQLVMRLSKSYVDPSWNTQKKPQLCPIWGAARAVVLGHSRCHQVPSTQEGRRPGPGHSASFQLCDLGVLISLSGLKVILGSPYDSDRCYLGIQTSWKRHRWAAVRGLVKDPYTPRQDHWTCDLESISASCAFHLPCTPCRPPLTEDLPTPSLSFPLRDRTKL